MNFVANNKEGWAMFRLDLNDENDRQVGISWLKELKPTTAKDQLEIDRAIVALGGDPEHGFGVDYELMQQ